MGGALARLSSSWAAASARSSERKGGLRPFLAPFRLRFAFALACPSPLVPALPFAFAFAFLAFAARVARLRVALAARGWPRVASLAAFALAAQLHRSFAFAIGPCTSPLLALAEIQAVVVSGFAVWTKPPGRDGVLEKARSRSLRQKRGTGSGSIGSQSAGKSPRFSARGAGNRFPVLPRLAGKVAQNANHHFLPTGDR